MKVTARESATQFRAVVIDYWRQAPTFSDCWRAKGADITVLPANATLDDVMPASAAWRAAIQWAGRSGGNRFLRHFRIKAWWTKAFPLSASVWGIKCWA